MEEKRNDECGMMSDELKAAFLFIVLHSSFIVSSPGRGYGGIERG